jgi:hypothetical protein
MSRIPAVPDGRQRVVIEHVTPQVDGGRFPVKAIIGDLIDVEADVFCDGHDVVRCRVLYRGARDKHWREIEMSDLTNDRWGAQIRLGEVGDLRFIVEGWVDHLATWRRDMTKRMAAIEVNDGSESTETPSQLEDVRIAVLTGADLIDAAAKRALVARGAGRVDFRRLEKWAAGLRNQPIKSYSQSRRGIRAASLLRAQRMSFTSQSTANVLGSRRGMNSFRGRAVLARLSMAVFETASVSLNTLHRWASTWCICHQFIQWASRFVRARTTRSARNLAMSAARGR